MTATMHKAAAIRARPVIFSFRKMREKIMTEIIDTVLDRGMKLSLINISMCIRDRCKAIREQRASVDYVWEPEERWDGT